MAKSDTPIRDMIENVMDSELFQGIVMVGIIVGFLAAVILGVRWLVLSSEKSRYEESLSKCKTVSLVLNKPTAYRDKYCIVQNDDGSYTTLRSMTETIQSGKMYTYESELKEIEARRQSRR